MSRTLHMAGYYPPPPQGERPPVHVEISIADEPMPDRGMPTWAFSTTVTFADGTSRGISSSAQASTLDDAESMALSAAIGLLAELLAEARTAKR